MTEKQNKLAEAITKAVAEYIDNYQEYGPYANVAINPEAMEVKLVKNGESTGKEVYDYIPAMEMTVLADPSQGIMEPDSNQIDALASQY